MAVVINGNGTVTGIAVGGLPDGIVDNGTMADDAVAIADLAATGTASATTFLRGDNSWQEAGGGAWNYITSQTASGQTSINFENVFDSTYDQYMITGTTIITSVDGTRMEWQAGTGSTPTYVTTGYQYHNGYVTSNSGSYSGGSSTSSTIGTIANYVGADTGQVTYFEHRIFNPSDTTRYKCFSGSSTQYSEHPYAFLGQHVGTLATTTAVTSLKYFCENGGYASGIFRLYGLANS